MPTYLTIEQVQEVGIYAFHFVSSAHDDDPAALVYMDGQFFYREHLFADPREYPDERDVELTPEQAEARAFEHTRRNQEWRHGYECDCRYCAGQD